MTASFYGPVSGPQQDGSTVTVEPGDYVVGTDVFGRSVSGKVVATHEFYPSVYIDGMTKAQVPGRFSVHLRCITRVVKAPTHDVLVGADFGAHR